MIPASWGDELLAAEVIRRCAVRENRPAIQCSCPRVAERLGAHASRLDDTILWLSTPPVAAAQYIRAHSSGEAMHITYAGACPGAIDGSIDQRVTPTELLLEISARGIDIAAQPTIFENIIPPDRRRHYSSPSGSPDPQRLWETAAFRVALPTDADLAVGVAQLLLSEERVLVDLAPSMGCICRPTGPESDPLVILRSPTPVVRDGVVDVTRAAPAMRESGAPRAASPDPVRHGDDAPPNPVVQGFSARRQTPVKPIFRRSGAWRRQTPRPGAVVARTSAVFVALREPVPLLQRTEVRVAIATAIAVATLALMIGLWIGRSTASRNGVLTGEVRNVPPAPLARSR